jgi:hypothetical protein
MSSFVVDEASPMDRFDTTAMLGGCTSISLNVNLKCIDTVRRRRTTAQQTRIGASVHCL